MEYLLPLARYSVYAGTAYVWYKLYQCDRKYVRTYMFNQGQNVSQKMKVIPYWDRYAEPFIIKEFGILFTAGNSFIKGLVSDNEDTESIKNSLEKYNSDVEQEIILMEQTIQAS